MLRGQWFRFGYACVNFGGLISARDWLAADGKGGGGDLRTLDKGECAHILVQGSHITAVQEITSGIRPLQQAEQAHESRLARARSPEDRYELAAMEGQRHVGDGTDRRIA